MKLMLFAGLAFGCVIALDAYAQVVRVEPTSRRGGSTAGAAGSSGTGGSVGSGPSDQGSGPSLRGSLGVTPGPVFQQPATPAPLSPTRPGGSGGGCTPKTKTECFKVAAECLLNKGLSGQKYTVSVEQTGWPYIGRFSSASVTAEEDSAAADCANDVRECVSGGC